MLGNAGETELDLRFQILGIPVRVHPGFWLMGAFICHKSSIKTTKVMKNLTQKMILAALPEEYYMDLGNPIFSYNAVVAKVIVKPIFEYYVKINAKTVMNN